jgi:hypothetical protein
MAIPDQVRLPLKVAAGVVRQGIVIRLGRSIVTMTGVVLGIAFLMSTLTIQTLKRGILREDELRGEANRMYGYLVAESGKLRERPLALIAPSAPSDVELRLLRRLEQEKVSELRVWQRAPSLPDGALERLTPRAATTPEALGKGAAALLVLGAAPLPRMDFAPLLGALHRPVLAVTADRTDLPVFAKGTIVVRLKRALTAGERARRAKDADRERFRGLWIVVISMLVTVIGISNAMLMSVTEQFRDIGTMKCLGATSRFIRTLFLLEASFMSLVGGSLGVLLGVLVSVVAYSILYGSSLIGQTLAEQPGALVLAALESLLAGVVLSVIAALYPATFAARMVPADALRSNI